MTADDLADLNGLLSAEVAARAIHEHDTREQSEIADDILREAEAPSITRLNHRLVRMRIWRATRIG